MNLHPKLLLPLEERPGRSRPFAASAALHIAIISVLCAPHPKQIELRTLQVDPVREPITYLAVPEMPAVSDAEGAQQGKHGEGGGQHLHRDSNAIRVARGTEIRPEIVQTPQVKLPVTNKAMADLLAFSQSTSPTLVEQALKVAAEKRLRKPEAVAPPKVDAQLQERPLDAVLSATRIQAPALATQPLHVAAEKLNQLEQVVTPEIKVQTPYSAVKELLAINNPALALPRPIDRIIVRQGSSRGPQKITTMAAPAVQGVPGSDPAMPSRDYGNAVVLSPEPGKELGTRANDSAGAVAMSSTGRKEPGLGGEGRGPALASGKGPGASNHGTGPGAASTGTGRGASERASNGTTPAGDPGGTGLTSGVTVIQGLSISGGSSVQSGQMYIGSFGPSPASRSPQMPLGPRTAPQVMIVGTSRSGGVLRAYAGPRKGPVYTIYIATGIGTAVVEFTEARQATHQFDYELTAPEALQSSLPPELGTTPIVVQGTLDSTGQLKQVKLLHAMTQELAAKLLRALELWRFRPVLRGDKAIEASVIIGLHLNLNE